MNDNLFKKFLSFSIGGYVALAIGFFTTPIVTRMILPNQYGLFSIIMVCINISALVCSFGLDQGFVRHFYEEKEENRGKLLYNSIKLPILQIFILGIIILFFRKKISLFLFQEYDLQIITVFILLLFLTAVNNFSILVVRMNQRAKLFSILQILSQLLNFIFIVFFFKRYGSNYRVLLFSAISSLSIVTVIAIFLEREIWKFKGKNENIKTIELILYSIPLSLTMALNWIFSSADKIAIKYFSTLTELGLYAAAFKIISLLNIIQTGFTTFWTPVAYEKYEKDKENMVFFEKIHEYISFFMFIVAIVLLMSREILIMILGPTYQLASNIVPMLTLMPIMYTISETTVMGLNFNKKTKYHLGISIIVALLNILGNLLLVPKLGARGAAISTGLAYIIFFSLRTYFSLKFIKFEFNLIRFYTITLLLVLFALYLSFNSNIYLTLKIGIILILLTIFLYKKMVKSLYLEFIKKENSCIVKK